MQSDKQTEDKENVQPDRSNKCKPSYADDHHWEEEEFKAKMECRYLLQICICCQIGWSHLNVKLQGYI